MTKNKRMKKMVAAVLIGVLAVMPVSAYAGTLKSQENKPATTGRIELAYTADIKGEVQEPEMSLADFKELRGQAEQDVQELMVDCADDIDEIESVEIVTDFTEEKSGKAYTWTDGIEVDATLGSSYVAFVPFLPKSEILGMLEQAYDGIDVYANQILSVQDADYVKAIKGGKVSGAGFTGTVEREVTVKLLAGKNTYTYSGEEGGYYLNGKWVAVP